MQLFWPKINFLETLSNIFDTIMAGHKKHNFFVLIPDSGFWPKNPFFDMGPRFLSTGRL